MTPRAPVFVAATMAAARRKPVARPKRRPTRPARFQAPAAPLRRLRRRRRQTRPRTTSVAALHPALSSKVWVPRPLRLTPTVRVREHITFPITAASASSTVALLGPCATTANSDLASTQVFGFWGNGVQVPFSTTTPVVASVLNSMGSSGGRLRFHRYGVTVACAGPTAVGVLIPSTYIKFGMLRSPIEVGLLPAISGIAGYLDSKVELHMRTAAEMLHAPVHFSAYPIDRVQWAEMLHFNNAAGLDFLDVLTIFALLIPPDASLTTFIISIHCEYDFIINEDSASAISSAHVLHPTVGEEALDMAVGAAISSSGLVEKVGSTVMGVAGRALPIMADVAPVLAAL